MDELAAFVALVLLCGTLLLVFYSIVIGVTVVLSVLFVVFAIPVLRGFLSALRSRPRGR